MPLIIPSNSQSASGYTIDQSIRFPWASITSGGYMHRTPSSAGDRTSWTWSCWFKLGGLNNFTPASNYYYALFSVDNATNDANRGTLMIIADSGVESAIKFVFQGHSTVFLKTTRQFRDPSAWMHLVLVWDSDNAVASERARLYINGQRETSFTTQNNPTSGQEIGINLNAEHRIGGTKNISSSVLNYPWDGYMADIHFLDGYSYGPEFFGETNDSNIWIPKEYSGSYGSNGFKIDGRDSADLGDDESGNGNDFTVSTLAAHDQVLDTPTNNFCTLNPLFAHTYDSNQTRPAQNTVTNQIIRYSSGANGFAVGTQVIPPSGKWYYELYTGPSYPALQGLTFGWTIFNEAIAGNKVYTYSYGIGQRHTSSPYSVWYYPATTTNTGLTPFGQGVTIGVAIDFSASTITLTKDGSAYGSKDFDDVSQPMSGYEQYTPYGMQSNDQDATCTFNFGADSTFNGQVSAGGNSDANGFGNFKYSVPANHLCLCTRNLGS